LSIAVEPNCRDYKLRIEVEVVMAGIRACLNEFSKNEKNVVNRCLSVVRRDLLCAITSGYTQYCVYF
jgi:hypothetical protein